MQRYFNLKYPFSESENGYFLELTDNRYDQTKSELALFILTKKGDIRYKPDFGLNLEQFIFEKIDDITIKNITAHISDSIKKSLPNINIKNIAVNNDNNQIVGLKINYSITDGFFEKNDFVDLLF